MNTLVVKARSFSRTIMLLPIVLGACMGPKKDAAPAVTGVVEESPPTAEAPEQVKPVESAPPKEESAEEDVWAPEVPMGDTYDWIRLKSGEWLKGEIETLSYKSMEFDSKELDNLTFDWEDVREVRTNRPLSILRADRTIVTGKVYVLEDRVVVTTDHGQVHMKRDDITRMVEGSPNERDHWSGKVSVGATVRKGNTDQVDISSFIVAKRRTASSRLDLSFTSAYGEVDSEETINNERFQGNYDLFVGPRLFITPLALDVFRDPFQNIALQAQPYTGIGYTLVDTHEVEWDVNLGVGYRKTEFDSVEADEEDSDTTGTAVVGTNFDVNVTEKVEFEFDYGAQIGVPETVDTNQNATLTLSFDFLVDVDVDFTIVWNRVGDPQPDSDGNTPKQDDFRFVFGFGWEF